MTSSANTYLNHIFLERFWPYPNIFGTLHYLTRRRHHLATFKPDMPQKKSRTCIGYLQPLVLLTIKAIHGSAPKYICDVVIAKLAFSDRTVSYSWNLNTRISRLWSNLVTEHSSLLHPSCGNKVSWRQPPLKHKDNVIPQNILFTIKIVWTFFSESICIPNRWVSESLVFVFKFPGRIV